MWIFFHQKGKNCLITISTIIVTTPFLVMYDICSKLDPVDNYREETWGGHTSVSHRGPGSSEMLSGEQMVTRPVSGEMGDTYTEAHTSLMRLDTFKTMDSATETIRDMVTSASEEFEKLYKVRKMTTFYKAYVTLCCVSMSISSQSDFLAPLGPFRSQFNSWFSFCIMICTFHSRLVRFSEKAGSGLSTLECAVEMDSKSRSSTLLRRR